jgi:uncharacterized membrane protein YbaN (DUF454 family)
MTNTQSKKKREGKERKKSKLMQNQIEPSYRSYQERKRIPRRIKLYGISTITTTLVSLTHRPKAMKRSTCARLVSITFFFIIICTKTKISLEIYNNNKKTIIKLQQIP